jgi:IS5 family transposase
MDKDNLFTGQPVFTQLLKLIPRELVEQISQKHNGDRYCKQFFAYDHLVSMLYAGFFQVTSIRELVTGLQANAGKLIHLGLKNAPVKSTFSDANQRRPESFFGDLYHQLYQKHFCLPDSRTKNKEDRFFIIDSTTIGLFSSIMHGAGAFKRNGKKKGGAKAHMIVDSNHDLPAFISITEGKVHDLVFLQQIEVPEGTRVVVDKAYTNYVEFDKWTKRNIKWVTRLKLDAVMRPVMNLSVDEEQYDKGVLSDRIVVLGRPSNQNKTPLIKARVVEYYDSEKNRSFSFITNDFFSDAFQIAEMYRRRWQIELLFKRIKQRYPLKYFLGESPNAIKIQIWTALICDLLVKIVQRAVNASRTKRWAYSNLSAMIKHHLMTYLNLYRFLLNPEKSMRKYKPPSQQLKLFETGAYF